MTAATDFAALHTRIEEVLFDGAGTVRTLAAQHRFSKSLTPTATDDDHAREAFYKKTAFATVSAGQPRPRTTGSVITDYNVTVRLDLYYELPDEVEFPEVRAALAKIPSDIHRIRGAFGWGGNLSATAAAVPTGLADGCLLLERWEIEPPMRDPRLLRSAVFFFGVVSVTH